jgi:long-subunit fatty acid transport protein
MKRIALATAAVFLAAACRSKTPETGKADSAAPAATGPAVGSVEWKIATYTSAAPPTISANATVLDWNDSLKAPGTELRKGTNGWTCLPLMPPPVGGYTTPVQTAAICADAQAMLWAEGYMTKTKPKNKVLGIGYMLHGDMGVSNTDPFGMTQTADNDWVVSGPHVMIFPADANRIKDVATDHRTGAPYQMWKGTPYAHIMIPTPAVAMQH